MVITIIVCLYIVDCVGVVMDETRGDVGKIACWYHLPWRCARSYAFGVHGTASRWTTRKFARQLQMWRAVRWCTHTHTQTHTHTHIYQPTAHIVSRGRARAALPCVDECAFYLAKCCACVQWIVLSVLVVTTYYNLL